MIAVSGAQALVCFSDDALSDAGDTADFSVGTYLGIRTRTSIVIGALSEITQERHGRRAGHRPRGPARRDHPRRGRNGDRFERGVSHYPKIGSAVVRVGQRELRLIFDVAGPNTINIGHLQQDTSIGAYINVDDMVRKHFAIFGSTGAGKSSGVAVILREIMEARPDLRMLLIDPHNEYGRLLRGPRACAAARQPAAAVLAVQFRGDRRSGLRPAARTSRRRSGCSPS